MMVGSGEFIPFASSPEHYRAKACTVWCFDARFAELYNEFLARRGFSRRDVDFVTRAGGAKALALAGAGESGEAPSAVTLPAAAARDDVLAQIRGSIALHHTDRVILMVHIDCGAYGGSEAFGNDHQAEWDHHTAELSRAAAAVRANCPDIAEVECWIADFDGARKVE